jgi:hypothetical protein
MRLVKIDNVVLNMDNIVMMKGHRLDNDTVEVYAYTQDTRHYVGVCESTEDYNDFMEAFYQGMVKNWLGEAISKNINEDEDKELWS